MTKQLTFTEALAFSNPRRKRSKTHHKLQQIHNLIDWKALETIVKVIEKSNTSKGGRKPIALSVKIKMLFIQHIYNMSDELLEDSLYDNIAFQEFAGLCLSENVPDFTTHWRFKEKLIQHRLLDKLFESIQQQLDKQHLHIEKGKVSIVDATIIASANKPLSTDKRDQLHSQPSSQIDTDAKSTEKRGKKYFGYKGHIGIDNETKLINKQSFSPANEHDINYFENLLTGKEEKVYADKAYRSKELAKKARIVKVQYKVLRKAGRNRSLSLEEIRTNKQWSKTRARVEHVFATMVQSLHYTKCRCKNQLRNQLTWVMNCIIYNVCRMNYLLKRQ